MPLGDAASKVIQRSFNEGTGTSEAVNSGVAVAISDPSVASTTLLTLNGVTPVITLPTPVQGKVKTVVCIQDGTGTRIPTWATPSGAIKWPAATAPVLSTAAGRMDRIKFECLDGVNWFGLATIDLR